MSSTRIAILTSLAMIAFAGNSLLCRVALKQTPIDPATFTTLRLISGAVTLWFIVRLRPGKHSGSGTWLSALALFVYAAGFSFAYRSLPTSSGALILFSAVQATMIFFGLWNGERFRTLQVAGLLLAFSGVIVLFLSKLSAPPVTGSLLMLCGGVAWGVYSLRGRGVGDPIAVTAGNFLRTVPLAAAVSIVTLDTAKVDLLGSIYAIASGAIASGLGYAIWYTALPKLKATTAAAIQLTVPLLAALGGMAFLEESLSFYLLLATIAILGGIALVIFNRNQRIVGPQGR